VDVKRQLEDSREFLGRVLPPEQDEDHRFQEEEAGIAFGEGECGRIGFAAEQAGASNEG
jgi:hypothetical protein